MTSPKLNTAAEVEAALVRLFGIGAEFRGCEEVTDPDHWQDWQYRKDALDAERADIIAAVVAGLEGLHAHNSDLTEMWDTAREALRVERDLSRVLRRWVVALREAHVTACVSHDCGCCRWCRMQKHLDAALAPTPPPECRNAGIDGRDHACRLPAGHDGPHARWIPPPESAVPPAGEGEL